MINVEVNMYCRLFMVVLFLSFIIGCSHQESPVDINIDGASQKELLKITSVKKDFATVATFSISEEINGNVGGTIPFSFVINSNGLKVSGSLTIPEKAFHSKELITIIVDDEYATVDFYPSPFVFDKPLILDLFYEGIELNGVDSDAIDFFHISNNNSYELINIESKVVSENDKLLGVVKAEIPHFSRFGWLQ